MEYLRHINGLEMIWVFAFFIASLLGVLYKFRLISFGRKKICEPGKCPDPECSGQVRQSAKDIKEVKDTINNKLFPKINRTNLGVERVEARLNTFIELHARK